MLLTLTTTRSPATDLGFLVHKHPDRASAFPLAFGTAHVVWPEADASRATMALLVEVDSVALVRGRPESEEAGPLASYVNDRPYVTSSFLSVAIAQVLRSALNRSCARPELVDEPLPLELRLEVVAARGGEGLIERLFGPLGYAVEVERYERDDVVALGPSALYRVRLRHTAPLWLVLRHLYVLLPVLDDEKHYWVGQDEVDKLVDRGEGWLEEHPERELVAERYLKHRRTLARDALERLVDAAVLDAEPVDEEAEAPSAAERVLEKPLALNDARMDAVVDLVLASGGRRVLDLGCGEGKLLRRLVKLRHLEAVVGVDVSAGALAVAERRLARLGADGARATLLHGSACYRDSRFDGFDVVVAVEVVEHLEPSRVEAFAAAVLGGARPKQLIVTTPNAEYNVRFGMPSGAFRHADHRFEWTRGQFRTWCEGVAARWGYGVELSGVGAEDPELGTPTQVGVFRCR